VTIDRRGKLEDEPFDRTSATLRVAARPGGAGAFDVQVARDKVLVRFRGRLVRTLTGADAAEIRAAVAAGDDAAVQLLVARKTGNFKRGNER
jgi:hypothetical protein